MHEHGRWYPAGVLDSGSHHRDCAALATPRTWHHVSWKKTVVWGPRWLTYNHCIEGLERLASPRRKGGEGGGDACTSVGGGHHWTSSIVDRTTFIAPHWLHHAAWIVHAAPLQGEKEEGMFARAWEVFDSGSRHVDCSALARPHRWHHISCKNAAVWSPRWLTSSYCIEGLESLAPPQGEKEEEEGGGGGGGGGGGEGDRGSDEK